MSDRLATAIPAFRSLPGTSPRRRIRVDSGAAPPRPAAWQERLASRLLLFLAPRLERERTPDPPSGLAPFERFEIRRPAIRRWRDCGPLSAIWYPAAGDPAGAKPRGAVLLVHPWIDSGQAFFYRRGRLRALRRAGYHAMTFDLGGVGRSGPRPAGFYDRDLEDALAALAARAEGLPLHIWGVSAGGYWAHTLLSRVAGVSGAFFEDVSMHLIEWSKRMAPLGLPFYLFFEHGLTRAYRFLDLRRHARCLRVKAAAYVSGERDRGVRPAETRELARLADAECQVVGGADHLQAVRIARGEVLRLALRTFERADASSAPVSRTSPSRRPADRR